MFRVLIFGFAVLVVFTGLVKVMPILEDAPNERQMATVVQSRTIKPSCIISSEKDSISKGEEVSIAWGTEHASTAELSGVGEVSLQGGMFVSPLESTTFTLTVRSQVGDVSTCVTEITVNPTAL